MEIVIHISNGDTIKEKYDKETTIGEISDSIIQKYIPGAKKLRLLLNSKFLDADAKLSDVGYTEGKVILGYPSPALKPKPKSEKIAETQKDEAPKLEKEITKSQEAPKESPKIGKTPEKPKEVPKSPPKVEKAPAQHSQQKEAPNKEENKIRVNAKCEKVRNLIMENPPYSLDAVIGSIEKSDPVLAEKIKKNPAPFLSLLGVPFTMDGNQVVIKTK